MEAGADGPIPTDSTWKVSTIPRMALGLVIVAAISGVSISAIGSSEDGIDPEVYAEAESFGDQVMSNILVDWDQEELVSQASPLLLQAIGSEALEAVLGAAETRLGPLVRHEMKGARVDQSNTSESLDVTTVTLSFDAVFEKGPATVEIGAIKERGEWRILGFNVNWEP